MIEVEQKRGEAKALRGVSYDPRIDRFTAEIYVGGERQWLGSYVTSGEASRAYLEAAAQRAPVVRVASAFRQVYAAFRDLYGGREGTPPVGAVLEYDGQRFVFQGMTWRRQGGGTFAYMTWESCCKSCGKVYRTMSPAALSVAKGVTRNCPEHVQARGFRPKGAQAAGPGYTLGEKITAVLAPLGLVHSRLPLGQVVGILAGEGMGERVPTGDVLARLVRVMEQNAEGPLGFTVVGEDMLFA